MRLYYLLEGAKNDCASIIYETFNASKNLERNRSNNLPLSLIFLVYTNFISLPCLSSLYPSSQLR